MKLILCFLFISNAFALTDQEVVKSVLEHFPLIEESILKNEAAEGALTAKKGAFDTKLKFKSRLWRQSPYNNEYYETYLEKQTPFLGTKLIAGHREGAGNFNYYDLKKQTSAAGQIFAGITLPVLRNLSTDEYRTDLKIARHMKEQAEQQVVLKKLMYVHKGLSLYYKWVLQSKKVDISRELLDLALKRQDMLTKKFKAGDADRLKVIDNQRQINKRQSELIQSEIDLKQEAAMLALYVRDSEGNPQKILKHENPEAVLSSLIPVQERRVNPQLKILGLEQKITNDQYELGKQTRLPGLDVSVTGARELSNRQGYGDSILQVGIQFDFPLENRKARGDTVNYHYKKKAIEKELIYMSQELNQQYEFYKEASSKSRDKWIESDKEFENTKKVALGERRKWSLGASDLFVVNLREQDQADVDKRRWAALYDYHQYHIDASLFAASLPIE